MSKPSNTADGVEATLDRGVAILGLELPNGATRALVDYVALLEKWNRVYNLTAIREPERMVSQHLLDSLAAVRALDRLAAESGAVRILDVGSGGGLPGIPIAIARPAWQVVLSEKSQKKCAFLNQAAVELGLSNVRVAPGRVEKIEAANRFDIVISRAFSDLATFARAVAFLLAPRGALVAMKGVYPAEEIAELPAQVVLKASEKLRVPGLEAIRHLIVMQLQEAES